MCLDRSDGSVVLARQFHVVSMLDAAVPSADADRMASWMGSVAAAEARKAEGASIHTLLTPCPHMRSGSNAFFHFVSESWTLIVVSSPFFSTMSKLLPKRIVGTWRGSQDI